MLWILVQVYVNYLAKVNDLFPRASLAQLCKNRKKRDSLIPRWWKRSVLSRVYSTIQKILFIGMQTKG